MESNDRKKRGEPEIDLPDSVGEAISEILSEIDVQIEAVERRLLADELLEEFTSPMMIQKAAGATSQVTVTMSPAGGVESARSVKLRNASVNLKQAAIAVPASLPAFAGFYEKHGITDDIGTSAVAILYLFGVLKPLAEILQIPLTKQAAAVLMTMWT